MSNVVVVVGNPKPMSRTREAGILLARKLTGVEPARIVDLAEAGPALVDWNNAGVEEQIAVVQAADLVVFASPTFRATYSGLLKLFLDRFPPVGLDGVHAVPMMLGGSLAHALAPELLLKPVLVEMGAVCPTAGLFLVDRTFAEDERLTTFVERARRVLPLKRAEAKA